MFQKVYSSANYYLKFSEFSFLVYYTVPESLRVLIGLLLNSKQVENGTKEQSWKGEGREEEEGREG